uniref:Uncharacterized protein n=1 Tax=Romanomermis culicivorax TaxID=13658 RepID=A0A915HIY5_ROMCU
MPKNLNLSSKLHIAVSIFVIIGNHFVVIDTISSIKNHHRHRKNELVRQLSSDQRQDATIVDTTGSGGKIERDDNGNFASGDENRHYFDETGFDRMLDPPDYIRNYSKNMYS